MTKTLEEKLASLAPARRKRIAARTAELVSEERSLRDLRQALELTQERLASELGVGQESISRLEKRSDLLISTLRSYPRQGGRASSDRGVSESSARDLERAGDADGGRDAVVQGQKGGQIWPQGKVMRVLPAKGGQAHQGLRWRRVSPLDPLG